ncbi:MAG: DUF4105 domain-containing protein [Gemmatimonadaceae bacterium]
MIPALQRAVTCAALTLSCASLARAQAAPSVPLANVDPLHQAGRNVTISLLTMGTSPDQIWEFFGHDAVWIHDNVTGRDTLFNWGVFDFSQPHFIPRFLEGRMLYAMGSDPLGDQIRAYQRLNRSVLAQELDLTAQQRDSILHQIQWYARPENVNYRYDYYRDNCATKVRDIIDNAIGGQIKAKAGALTGTTYRSHSLRLMQLNLPIMLGVDIGLGRPADHDLTKWQTMFLPTPLHDFLSTLQVTDSAGGMHPLVKREVVLFQATRPPEPDAPPTLWPWLLGAGLILAALFVVLGRADGRAAGMVAGVLIGVWSLVAGILGTLLTLLWTVTDHVFAHANENLLLFNPLWLVLAVVALVSLWRGRESPWFRTWAAGLALLAALALVAHLVRFSAQDNLALIGLALPPALAIAWVARLKRPVRSS